VTVWLAALVSVVWLFQQRAQRFQVLGIAQGQERQVAMNCPGRIERVNVRLYDQVRQGQVLAIADAVLDNEFNEPELRARLATITAQIEHLAAQLVPMEDDLEVDRTTREAARAADMRRFAVDVENSRLRILELQAQLASDEITLENLTGDLKIIKELVERDAVAPIQLENLQAEYMALTEKISENERLLEQARAALENAEERRAEYLRYEPRHPSVRNALEVIHKAIAVQDRQMTEVRAQLDALDRRRSLELVAPLDGVVSQIAKGPGEAVTAGDPILMITAFRPSEVIGYAQRDQFGLVEEDMSVEIVKPSYPPQIVSARVSYVGPAVVQLPAQLWPNPNSPQYGRPFTVELPAESALTLIPGEVVGIRGL
jgi:multidrug resistance efflux pump